MPVISPHPYTTTFRGFVKDTYRFAEFVEGDGRDHRLGAGVEYRDRTWTASGAITTGFLQNTGVGADLNLTWHDSDHWRHGVDLQFNSLETPLRGVRQGVEGDLLRWQSSYRWHESRQVGVAVAAMDFNDDNDRQWINLTYAERVANWPQHKLTLLGGYFASRNDSDEVTYYSPLSDQDIGVDLEHECASVATL